MSIYRHEKKDKIKVTFVLFYFLMLSCVFSSCVADSGDINSIETECENKKAYMDSCSHTIPLETALNSLQDFMSTSFDATRGQKDCRNVSNVFPVHFNSVTTRAVNNSNVNCENLVYVANFEQDNGYAVLAADDRIKDQVIAIIDDGNVSEETILSASKELSEDRPIIDGFPLTGDGFITDANYPGEIFMNPNTVDLYDSTEDDTLVGDFSLDDIDAVDENGNPTATRSCNDIESSEKYACRMFLSYAVDEVLSNGGGGGGASSKTIEIDAGPWSDMKNVKPILGNFVGWSQHGPFNNLYPQVRKYLIFGSKKVAPAGCFPLSIAKVLAYFEYPYHLSHNGYVINWAKLKNDLSSTEGSNSAAHLLKYIYDGCDCLPFYNGTFTFPKKAVSFMNFHYLNAHKYDYGFARVSTSIDQGRPVIIYGCPNINIFKSHCWNIDGYKIRTRSVTEKTYIGNNLLSETKKTEKCEMVHCDFGWGGSSNGYYVSGIFNTDNQDVEYDSNVGISKVKYNNYLHIITYDIPN